MNRFTESKQNQNESKIKYDYNDSSEDEDEYDEEEYDDEEVNGLHCKNIDPALAKLMGIIIESQKSDEEIDWKPPSKCGLDNSKEIISSSYFQNKDMLDHIDFFKVIKEDIIGYRTLTSRQLDYIKNLNNDEKFELIEIYNKVLDCNKFK